MQRLKFGDDRNNHFVIKIITWIKNRTQTKKVQKVTKRISPVNLWHERSPYRLPRDRQLLKMCYKIELIYAKVKIDIKMSTFNDFSLK